MSVAVNDLPTKISTFLCEELGRKEIRMAVRIELVHSPAGFRAETLKEWRREDEADAPYFAGTDRERAPFIEQLATDIITLAEERADVFRQSDNTFTLRTFQHGGGRRGYAFRIMPGLESDGGGGSMQIAGDQNATAQGVLAQQMRNNEFLVRINKDSIAGTIGVLTTICDDLRRENKELREERSRLVAEINARRSDEAAAELAVVRQAGQEQRKDMIVSKAVSLLPVVAARMLPGAGGVGSGDAIKALVSELGGSIKPQQMAAIAGALTTEQRILFSEVMKLAANGENDPGKANGAAVKSPAPSTAT